MSTWGAGEISLPTAKRVEAPLKLRAAPDLGRPAARLSRLVVGDPGPASIPGKVEAVDESVDSDVRARDSHFGTGIPRQPGADLFVQILQSGTTAERDFDPASLLGQGLFVQRQCVPGQLLRLLALADPHDRGGTGRESSHRALT